MSKKLEFPLVEQLSCLGCDELPLQGKEVAHMRGLVTDKLKRNQGLRGTGTLFLGMPRQIRNPSRESE